MIRRFFKFCFFAIGSLVVFYFVVSAIGSNAPTSQGPRASLASPTITLEKFEGLKTGMTLEQVERSFGSPGVLQGENQIGNIKTVSYQWNGGFMVAVNCIFQNGKLSQKTQIGLTR